MTLIDSLLVWLDAGLCSQNPVHTLAVGGNLLSLCARTTGLFGAAFAGILVFNLVGRKPPAHVSWLVLVVPLAVDGTCSLAGSLGYSVLYESTNVTRFTTGVAAGFALAVLVGPRVSFKLLAGACVVCLLAATVSLAVAVSLACTLGAVALLVGATRLAPLQLKPASAWVVGFGELLSLACVAHALGAVVAA